MGNKVSHKGGIDQIKKSKRPLNSASVDNISVSQARNGGNGNVVSPNKSVTKLEVKIFRSYTNLNDFGKRRNMTPDRPTNIRIYKKSLQRLDSSTLQHDNYDTIIRPVSRCHSLPRSFGKSRGLRISTASMSSNENMNSMKDERHSHLGFNDQSSNAYKVKKVDFVSTKDLKERIKLFEENLVAAILSRLASLPISFQTSVIPLALFPPSPDCVLGPHSLLTLKCYLEDESDFYFDPIRASADGLCALFVPPSCLRGLQFVKDDPTVERILEFSKMLFTNISREAAADLSRMFEYQVGLLSGDVSICMLADFVADRILSYVCHDMKVPLVDRNSLVLGAIKGRIESGRLPPAVVSVILGMKELKWNLYDVIDKPGVRRDLLFYKEGVTSQYEPDQSPFQFFSSSSSDHMTYGYRGEMLELDFSKGVYKHYRAELDEYSDEVLWRYDDFHRIYSPYFQIVGDKLFKKLISDQQPGVLLQSDLDAHVQCVMDKTTYSRDAVAALLVPSSRINLPDETIRSFNPDLVDRVPETLLNGWKQSFTPASPVLSTDFPISDSNEAYSSSAALTSTPTAETNAPALYVDAF